MDTNAEYMTGMAAGFLSELTEIQKTAAGKGAFGFLTSGLHNIGEGLVNVGKKGGFLGGLGGAQAAKAGGVVPHMQSLWRAGARSAKRAGGSQFLGGLKNVAGSRYGQAAATVAAPVAGIYAAKRMMSPQYQGQGYY